MTVSDKAARYVAAYTAVAERVGGLVIGHGSDSWVPSCPEWRVHDVLAHLVGLCDDWVHARLAGYASRRWTADQVSRLTGSSDIELVDRWTSLLQEFGRLEDDPVMGAPARWAFGDAVIHEADVRGALDAGRVPHEAVILGLRGSLARWGEALGQAGLGDLVVRAREAGEWRLGSAGGPTATTVDVPVYELFRALAGRRSAGQVRSWAWSTDPEPYLAAGLPYPFRYATAPLSD